MGIPEKNLSYYDEIPAGILTPAGIFTEFNPFYRGGLPPPVWLEQDCWLQWQQFSPPQPGQPAQPPFLRAFIR